MYCHYSACSHLKSFMYSMFTSCVRHACHSLHTLPYIRLMSTGPLGGLLLGRMWSWSILMCWTWAFQHASKLTRITFGTHTLFKSIQSIHSCTAVKGCLQAQIKHKLQIAALIGILLATRQSATVLDWNPIMATAYLFLYLNHRVSGAQELASGFFQHLCTRQQLVQI